MSFSDLLNGVDQRECRSYSADGNKSEGGHKSIALTRSFASMAEAVDRRQQNRQEIDGGNEIRNCEAKSA
jgi:hypothetical protein